MTNRNDIVIILDSILDDYYFLWECYSEYTQIKQNENQPTSFSQSLKEAFELGYFSFYESIKFNGDEKLLKNFILNDYVIEKLLDCENIPEMEIRVSTSKKGVVFLNQYSSSSEGIHDTWSRTPTMTLKNSNPAEKSRWDK